MSFERVVQRMIEFARKPSPMFKRLVMKQQPKAIDADLYNDLVEFLEDQQDADCKGDPPQYVPNKAMQLLMRLQGQPKSAERVAQDAAKRVGTSHREMGPHNFAANEVLLARARDLLYQTQGTLGFIGVMDAEVLRQQIKTFLEYTKQPPQVLAECEECERIIVSPLRRFDR